MDDGGILSEESSNHNNNNSNSNNGGNPSPPSHHPHQHHQHQHHQHQHHQPRRPRRHGRQTAHINPYHGFGHGNMMASRTTSRRHRHKNNAGDDPMNDHHKEGEARRPGTKRALLKEGGEAEDAIDHQYDDDDGSASTDSEMFLSGKLPEGSFSFLVSAPVVSSPFLAALFVFVLKTTIYALIVSSMIGPDPTNRLGFPASVVAPVIVSQFFALLITVCTQDDVVQGLNLLYQGYRHDGLGTAFEGATMFKWLLGVFCHLTDGVFGMAVTFLLIVTSGDVVELLLNFTAVEFVSLLDNGAFFLASLGFMGKANKEMAEDVSDTVYAIARKRMASPTVQMWMLIISYLTLVAGWGAIYERQVRGVYTPGMLVVQFDDELDVRLGTFSGRYFLVNRVSKFGFDRIRYKHESSGGMFGYCSIESLWTFSEQYDVDPCLNYTAKSSFSTDFDITTTEQDIWYVTNDPSTKRYYPMPMFQIALGCFLDDHCGGVGRGVCESNHCVCNEPYYGWTCDYVKSDTCDKIEADQVTASGFTGSQPYADRFFILQDQNDNNKTVTVYDHPVYLSNVNAEGNGDVVVFLGMRWGLFKIPQFLKTIVNTTDRQAMAEYFADNPDIRMFLATSHEFFASSSVEFNTPSDFATPIGLEWRVGRRGDQEPSGNFMYRGIDSVLICATCGATNPCAFGNPCSEEGTCQCLNGATGTLCRVTPVGDGLCDPLFFNSPAFDYDGGDCCESTCTNRGNNTCGFAVLDETNVPINVEFPNCINPSALCDATANPETLCWAPKTAAFNAIAATQGYTLALSGNGRVLVEAAPLSEKVRVADQVDSTWRARGSVLEDVRGSLFGSKVAFYTPPGDVSRRSVTLEGVDVVVAVGLYRLEQAALKVYAWDTTEELWSIVATELALCRDSCLLTDVAVGLTEDETVVIVAGLDNTNVFVYTADRAAAGEKWQLQSTIPAASFALSRDGSTLAVLRTLDASAVDVYEIVIPTTTTANGGAGAGGESTAASVIMTKSGDVGFGVANTTVVSMVVSHDGTFLSAVTLSLDGQADKLQRFNLVNDFPPTSDYGEIVGPISRKTIAAGFVPALLSSDGTGVAFSMDMGTADLVMQSYAYLTSTKQWQQVGETYESVELDSSFSVSSDGASLVVGRQGRLNAFKTYPECLPNDDSYRLSAVLGAAPDEVSWSLQSYRQIGNKTIFTGIVDESCKICYNSTMYKETNIVKRGCVPKDQCLLLKYNDTSARRESYFRLFRDESAKWNRVAGQYEEVVSIPRPNPNSANNGCWSPDPLCQSDAVSLFSITITRDHFLQQPNWNVHDEAGNLLGQSKPLNFSDSPPSTVVVQDCFPTELECFIFTIDYDGDECCKFGTGQYRLNWKDYELNRTNDELFRYGERMKFGNCSNMEVDVADNVAVEFELDDNPDDLKYFIVDADGQKIAEWEITNAGLQTRQRSADSFFMNDQIGCLSFFIEDAGEDGFSGPNGGGYTVFFNNKRIVERSGNFGYAERTTFGKGPFCPVNTIQSEFITVLVLLDRAPTQVSWYFGDEEGNPIGEITRPEQPLGRTVVRSVYDPIANNDPRRCFTFNIMDDNGDGLCCNRGNGTYQLYLGWDLIHDSQGEFGYGERIRFGRGCNGTEIIPGSGATMDLTYDNRPSQTSWRIEDHKGTYLHGEDNFTVVSGKAFVKEIVHWFPETPEEECLFFFIEDTAGDGICCDGDANRPITGSNGRFDLGVNGTHLYGSVGRYGYGERVQFGRDCPTKSTASTVIEMTLRLDAFADETRWYFADCTGNILGSISRGAENQTEAFERRVVYAPVNTSIPQCYTFTIVDDNGDGICCQKGRGGYELDLNRQRISSGNGEFGYAERIRFSGDPLSPAATEVGFAATFDLELQFPDFGATWTVEDIRGNTLFSSLTGGIYSNNTAVHLAMMEPLVNMTETVFHFPNRFVVGNNDAATPDDCLYFSVMAGNENTDNSIFAGPPPSTNLHFDLFVDGFTQYTQAGSFNWGQRVQFGNANCAAQAYPGVLLTVEIELGTLPNTTSWTVYDLAVDKEVTSVAAGTYTTPSTTVTETFAVYYGSSYRLDIASEGGLGYYRLLLDRSVLNSTISSLDLLTEGNSVPSTVPFNTIAQ